MNTLMRALCALVIGLLAIPTVSFALTADEIQAEINRLLGEVATLRARMVQLQQQQQASSTPQTIMPAGGLKHRLCAKLIRNLREGVEGDDVRALQEFLQLGGWLNTTPTGFFGPMTREALKRWQAQSGIVSGGNAETTGWGIVGPRTRSFLQRWCGSLFTNPVATTTTATSSLSLSGVVSTSTTSGNQPPVISGVVGPSTLPVEIEGTWTITASDPEGGPLSYQISWGDGDLVLDELIVLAGSFDFVSTNVFNHTYDVPGLYKLAVRVRDNAGGISLANIFVQVQSTEAFLDWFDEVTGGGSGNGNNGNNGSGGTACTADAFQCPNGQWVGRTGPNCQFACSNSSSNEELKSKFQQKLMNTDLSPYTEKLRPLFEAVCDSGWGVATFCEQFKAPDGACRFNGIVVRNGSWVTAWEKREVLYEPCKMEIRTCQNGTLSGTYKSGTCSTKDLGFGNPG